MPFKVEDYMVRLLMKVTASQAVKTTAKLQTIGKQLSLIGTNLLSGKYASVQDLKRVRASVVNASNIARRANDQLLDGVSSKKDLQDIISCGDSETIDKAIESTLEVATRAAMLCKAIDGEIEDLEPAEVEEEVTDEILDDEGADVQASEDEVEVSDEIGDDVADDVEVEAKCSKASEDVEVKDEDGEVDVTDDEISDEDEISDKDEDVEVEASEDDEEVEEVEAPIVAKKKAAVATKKASVVKKSASFKGGISWTMPALPEAKRR